MSLDRAGELFGYMARLVGTRAECGGMPYHSSGVERGVALRTPCRANARVFPSGEPIKAPLSESRAQQSLLDSGRIARGLYRPALDARRSQGADVTAVFVGELEYRRRVRLFDRHNVN